MLTHKQVAGFDNLELSLNDKWGLAGSHPRRMVRTTDATLDEVRADIKKLLDANQVATKAESPLRVSVTSAEELERLKKVRDRLRGLPPELIDAKLFAALGDGEAAAGELTHAQAAHAAAETAAHDSSDLTAEADAAYKQYKDACELKSWDAALATLNRAVALDERRFRPVPKHYAVLGILGAGAFGVVLKCPEHDPFRPERERRRMRSENIPSLGLGPLAERGVREANTLKQFTHANVIRVLDFGYADGDGLSRPFLAMELFDGVTLEDWLSTNKKLSVPDFVEVFGQIAAALKAAHDEGVIHRDVKPANVMVRKDGDRWVVKGDRFRLGREVVKPAHKPGSQPERPRSRFDRLSTSRSLVP